MRKPLFGFCGPWHFRHRSEKIGWTSRRKSTRAVDGGGSLLSSMGSAAKAGQPNATTAANKPGIRGKAGDAKRLMQRSHVGLCSRPADSSWSKNSWRIVVGFLRVGLGIFTNSREKFDCRDPSPCPLPGLRGRSRIGAAKARGDGPHSEPLSLGREIPRRSPQCPMKNDQ